MAVSTSAPAALIFQFRDNVDAELRVAKDAHNLQADIHRGLTISLDIDSRLTRITLMNRIDQQVEIDRIVAEKDLARLINGDDRKLFGGCSDCAGFGNVHFNAGIHRACRDHEDDEEDERDVDKRRNVDFGKRGHAPRSASSVSRAYVDRHRRSPPALIAEAALDQIKKFEGKVIHLGSDLFQRM